MKLESKDIRIIADYFSSKPIVRAFVFGSYSSDEALPESDLDILVELDYTKHVGLEFVKMKYELEDKLHKKVDLVSAAALSKHIKPFVDLNKQLIYER